MVASVGATILYLPPYSPDLNPIELMWSKIKAALRLVQASAIAVLPDAIPTAFSSVIEQDAIRRFLFDGYSS